MSKFQNLRSKIQVIVSLFVVIIFAIIGVKLLQSTHASSNIQVTLASGQRSMVPDMFGSNGEGFRDIPKAWLPQYSPGFQPAVKSLQPGLIRVGGGTTANYWNWKTGTFNQSDPKPNSGITQGCPCSGQPPVTIPLKLSDWASVLNYAGSDAVFDINMETGANGASCSSQETTCINDQIAMLSSAQSLGLAIKYVELGNEVYLDGTWNVAAFSDGIDYANKANQWATAIKRVFPNVKIAACDLLQKYAGPKGPGTRMGDWPGDLANHLDFGVIDAVTYHDYWTAGTTISSSDPTTAATVIAKGVSEFNTLDRPDLQALRPGVGVWLTEWNFLDSIGGTWADGLAMDAVALTQLTQANVQVSTPHSLLGSQTNNPFYAIISSDDSISPFGEASTMLHKATNGATSGQALNFSPDPAITGTSQPALLGWKFTAGSNTNAILLNLSGSSYTLNLPSPLNSTMSMTQMFAAYDANASAAGLQHPTTGQTNGTVTLPAYSVTKLSNTSSTPPPPTVSISSPTNGATVIGKSVSINASANVASPQTITGMTLKFAGKTINCGGTPCSTTWDSTTSANGSYTIEADATASGNGTGSATITVTVSNPPPGDTTTPSVPTGLGLTSGQQPTTSSIPLSWNASTDPDDTASQIHYTVLCNGATISSTAAGTTSYTDTVCPSGTNLTAGTPYDYSVTATDRAGNTSAPSTVFVGTTQKICVNPPAAPTNLSGSAPTATTANLNWSPVTPVGACTIAYYIIERDGADVGHSTTTFFPDSGLAEKTTYSYSVVAQSIDNTGSNPSTAINITTPAVVDTTPPPAPTGVAATTAGSDQIDLTWNPVTDPISGIKDYQIQRDGQVIDSVTTPCSTTCSYGDSGLSPNTTYSYVIIAENGAGLTTASNTVTATTLVPAAPGSTTGTTPGSSSTNIPLLQGTTSVGAGSDNGSVQTTDNPTAPTAPSTEQLIANTTASPTTTKKSRVNKQLLLTLGIIGSGSVVAGFVIEWLFWKKHFDQFVYVTPAHAGHAASGGLLTPTIIKPAIPPKEDKDR